MTLLDPETTGRPPGGAAGDRRPAGPRQHLVLGAQRLPARPHRSGRGARPGRGRPPGRGHRRRRRSDARLGGLEHPRRWPPTPSPPSPVCTRSPSAASPAPHPAAASSSPRCRSRSPPPTTRRCCADWLASGDSLPDGVVVDLELRWRVLLRLAKLGAVDRDQLAAALAEETTAVSQVEHAKALAALPDAEAKAWAWQRFTGEVEVPNYELEAIGLGLWQVGQERLTDPYVARYFDEVLATTEVAQQPDAGRGDQRSSTRAGRRPRTPSPGRTTCSAATTSTRRSAASWSTRPGTWSAASRSARRSADDRPGARPRRPGPTVRTRVTELGARTASARREDQLATEEPLEIRRRLARLPRPARLGDDADTRPRLRAGGRVQLTTRASRPPPRSAGSPTAPTSTSTPEQEFNVVTVTLTGPADIGHRHTRR